MEGTPKKRITVPSSLNEIPTDHLLNRVGWGGGVLRLPPGPSYWASICKRLRSPGIDSEKSTPPGYVAWRAGTTNRVAVPARQAGIDSWAP